MKVHALYVWLQHNGGQKDIDCKTLDMSLFTLDMMKDLRKTQSRTMEYTRKKDKHSYIQVKVCLYQELQWMAFSQTAGRQVLQARINKR